MKRWMSFVKTLSENPWLRGAGLTIYFVAILVGLILLYGKGDFTTPTFIYQGF